MSRRPFVFLLLFSVFMLLISFFFPYMGLRYDYWIKLVTLHNLSVKITHSCLYGISMVTTFHDGYQGQQRADQECLQSLKCLLWCILPVYHVCAFVIKCTIRFNDATDPTDWLKWSNKSRWKLYNNLLDNYVNFDTNPQKWKITWISPVCLQQMRWPGWFLKAEHHRR